MLNLAGWFVTGAIPVGGVASTGAAWVSAVLGIAMLFLVVLLAVHTAGRAAAVRVGLHLGRILSSDETPAPSCRRCVPAPGL